MTKKIDFDFNNGLIELEEIVKKMEQSDMSLDDSLKYFEQGIKLSKQCQEALAKAEQKVLKLTQDSDYTEAETIE